MKTNVYVKLLTDAKQRLASNKDTYVCCAVSHAADTAGLEYWGDEATKIRGHIMKLIGAQETNCTRTVYDWLRDQGVNVMKNDYKLLRDYRIAWIDHLIKDFQ